MGKTNRSTRQKRQARRAGAGPAGEGRHKDLVSHTQRCPCAACEEERKRQLKRGITQTDQRRRTYRPGDAQPEHRERWPATAHALAEYMALHDVDFDRRRRVSAVDLRPEFLGYLDAQLPARELDPGRLYEAFLALEYQAAARGSARGRILRACVLERRSQSEVASAEHMTQQAVSKNLHAALDDLADLYLALQAADQALRAAS